LRSESRDADALLAPIVSGGEALPADTLDPAKAAAHAKTRD
jgi:hypothetical protein